MTQCYSFAEISLPWSDARLGFVSDPRPPTFPGRRGVVMPARRITSSYSKRFPPPLVLAASCEVACPGRPVTQFHGYGPPLQCITTPSRQDSA
ncbi:hypothetical protein F2Q69_00004690 [Brassica cretica]|uniref:Uncharacterized protein n=1 Tax=Brassica cretica TaxID=69181 RepID=A0A8S9NVM9_BRACR|nr:hypothetical protein F2Q69_00004690 [Brassica cretica]